MSSSDKTSSILPLFEVIMAIFIFMILSTSIVSLYIGANRLQRKGTDVSRAIIIAENIAEELHTGADKIPAEGKTGYMYASGDHEYEVSLDTEIIEGRISDLAKIHISILDGSGDELTSIETAVEIVH